MGTHSGYGQYSKRSKETMIQNILELEVTVTLEKNRIK